MNDKPIEGVKTDVRNHPAGKKGALLSLDEVADRAWKARMSPRLRAWASQQLDKAGRPKGRRQQAQALLDEFRKKVPYIADPVMGEFIATPDQTLCLDDGGLCMLGGDCDDHSVTLAAALMSIGIPAMIVGSSHREPSDTPTHVYLAFQDELGDWVRMDGTLKSPVGSVSPYLREWWVEPGKEAKDQGKGDFVGMSEDKGVGVDAPASAIDLLYPGIR
jgi:transglutaminase-like putative cysteine protease